MEKYIATSITYAEYSALLDRLIEKGETTGPNQSEALVNFTKLNRQRMRRLERTVGLTTEAAKAASSLERQLVWLIITEGWCGDAGQSIPVIEKVAQASEKIETRYILRDDNLELMDRFLTNGARAIPKLIALDAATLEVLGSWGARPAAAQRLYEELKGQGIAKPEIMEALQRWYNADAGVSVQTELSDLLKRSGTGGTIAAAA